jgi:hypothetical protein
MNLRQHANSIVTALANEVAMPQQSDAAEVAQVLVDQLVNQDRPEFLELEPALEGEAAARYQERLRVFRVALLLMILVTEEPRIPAVAKIRLDVERLLFQKGDRPSLTTINSAMQSLKSLFDQVKDSADGARLMALWARNWFRELGIHEENPYTLTLFSTYWTTFASMAVSVIRDVAQNASFSWGPASR